jgi:hypothetical protein
MWTKERRLKFSEIAKQRGFGKWMIGRKLSKITRRKMSKGRMGKGNSFFNKHHSEEAKEKNRLAHLGKIGSFAYHWKGGKTKHSRGYIMIYKPNHPFCVGGKYVLEHRLVMEKTIGRYLHKWELVHHVNEIKDDNRLENLQIVSQSEHKKIHNNKII